MRAGADILAHTVADPIDDEYVQLALSGDVIHTSSIGVAEGYARLADGFALSKTERRCVDPEVIEAWEHWNALLDANRPNVRSSNWRAERSTMLENIRRLHEVGVRFAVGSDGGNVGSMHGTSFQNELLLLGEAGLQPLEVIEAATRNGAEALGLSDQLGTIEPGKFADLVLLSADPALDLANLLEVAAVVVRGRVLGRSAWGDA